MPAYWVARSKINDPVEYKKYTDLVPAIIAKFGGKVLARGGRFQIMEGPDKFHRFIVIEFPDLRAGRGLLQIAGIRRGRGIPAQRRGRGRDHHGRRRRRHEVVIHQVAAIGGPSGARRRCPVARRAPQYA